MNYKRLNARTIIVRKIQNKVVEEETLDGRNTRTTFAPSNSLQSLAVISAEHNYHSIFIHKQAA